MIPPQRPFAPLPSGLLVPEDVARRRLARPTAFDAFCGAGGFSLGVLQAGFKVVGAIDNDVTAAITYMTNLCRPGVRIVFTDVEAQHRFTTYLEKAYRKAGLDIASDGSIVADGTLSVAGVPVAGSGWIAHEPASTPGVPVFIFGDVRQVTGAQICAWLGLEVGELDLLMGGPPCQGFSMAGKRDIMDPRSSLVFEFARLACEMRPCSLCMENVPAITSMTAADGRPVLECVLEILESGDYARSQAMRDTLRAHFGKDIVLGRGPTKRRDTAPSHDAQEAKPAPARDGPQMEMAL